MKVVDDVRMCDDCEKKPFTVISLSMKQMIIGGLPPQYRHRCQSCENKAAKNIDRMLRDLDAAVAQ